MPSAPAASSHSSRRSHAASSDREDVRCHAEVAQHRSDASELAGGRRLPASTWPRAAPQEAEKP